MPKVDLPSLLNPSSIWNSLEKAATSYPCTLAAVSAILATLSYLSSKSRFFFRWPVAVVSAAGSAILAAAVFRAITGAEKPGDSGAAIGSLPEEDSPGSSEGTKLEEPSLVGENDSSIREEAREVDGKSEDIEKNPESEKQAEKLEDKAEEKQISEDDGSWHEDVVYLFREDTRAQWISLAEGSKPSPILSLQVDPDRGDSPQAILDSLTAAGYSAREVVAAIKLHKRLSPLKPNTDSLLDEVQQTFRILKAVQSLLKAQNTPCSLEGISLTINLLEPKEREKLLSNEPSDVENSWERIQRIVSHWNAIEPLKAEGYLLEELFFALVWVLGNATDQPHQQAKEAIDTARTMQTLLIENGYERYPFDEIFFMINPLKKQMGSLLFDSLFSAMGAKGFCEQIVMLKQQTDVLKKVSPSLEQKGYTKEEIQTAFMWIQGASALFNPEPLSVIDPSTLEDVLFTAKQVATLFEKHIKEKYSFKEILPAVSEIKQEDAKSFETRLKRTPEILCKNVEKKILEMRNSGGLMDSFSNLMPSLSSFLPWS